MAAALLRRTSSTIGFIPQPASAGPTRPITLCVYKRNINLNCLHFCQGFKVNCANRVIHFSAYFLGGRGGRTRAVLCDDSQECASENSKLYYITEALFSSTIFGAFQAIFPLLFWSVASFHWICFWRVFFERLTFSIKVKRYFRISKTQLSKMTSALFARQKQSKEFKNKAYSDSMRKQIHLVQTI